MPHKLEISPSGRATCKTCSTAIPKGELRFGEAYSSQFTDEALRWHHLMCAAKKLPHELADALTRYEGQIPNREAVDAAMEEGKKGVKAKPKGFPNADRAPTNRAKCLVCAETIEKGTFRVAVEREVDTGSFTTKGAGYLHPKCALAWAEENDAGEDFAEQVKGNTTALSAAEIDEVMKGMEGA
jgi:hypothetical protein